MNTSPIPAPDSLVFENAHTLLFGGLVNANLNSLNIGTGGNSVLTSGLDHPADIALNPGHTLAYVANVGTRQIVTVNLGTGVVTPLLSGVFPQGLVFDAAGQFFANLYPNVIAQINPTTGGVIRSITLPGSVVLDGLAYDPFSGKLWASDFNGGVIEAPTSLSSFVDHPVDFSGGDGLEPDGKGSLFVAVRSDFTIHLVNEVTFADTPLTTVSGLDDIAPVVGNGSPVPEPASLVVLGVGLLGIVGARRAIGGRR